MFRKLPRLLFVASLAIGFAVAPITGASASDSSGVDVHNPPAGFANGPAGNRIDVPLGYTVFWYVKEGTHNVTAAEDVPNSQKWGTQKASGDLTPDSDPFSVKFTKAGKYFYFSSVNGEGADDHGQLSGMWGVVNVTDPNATTTTTTTAPPTTTTTQPATITTQPPAGPTPTTAPAPAGVAGHVPTTAAPAPTTTSPTKPEKDKKPKDETSTTTTVPVSGPVDLSAESIVPNVTPNGTATQDGTVAPSSTPTGEAVALLKEKHGTKGVKLLIVTGLGIGALGIGAGAYKYANRSSKYFPA